MNLKEAKKILNDNGYKVELNEDLRKAWDEVKDSVGDAVVGGFRKLSPKVQQFIQDTIPLGAALKEAGTIYGFRVEKEEGFYKLTVRNKHTSTAPDFLHIKGFRGNIEVNIDGAGWTTKTIHVNSKKELMDLLETVLYSADWEQPEAAAKGWFKMPQNESTITEASKYDYEYDLLRNEYFPDAKDIDIHANRSIRSPLWKTLYGWECEFYLNGKRHWFTFGKGGCGFEPSLQAYIRKYCKLDSFDDYKEIKEEYPDATLEDIRNIATMG